MFVKQPQPGFVKTRLGQDLGPQAAADLYRCFQGDLIERLGTLAERRVLAYTPQTPAAADYFANHAHAFELRPQQGADLGSRMHRFFQTVLQAPDDRAVLVGSDCPTLPSQMIEEAFAALHEYDCVVGPALDGGYCLIGLRRPLAALFSGIAWSTEDVLRETLNRLDQSSRSWCLLAPWYDVDTLDDLRVLRAHRRTLLAGGVADPCPRTGRWLERFET